MVLKLYRSRRSDSNAFWSYVILDSTETRAGAWQHKNWFWSYVILDGTETYRVSNHTVSAFWSYVILDGTETNQPESQFAK